MGALKSRMVSSCCFPPEITGRSKQAREAREPLKAGSRPSITSLTPRPPTRAGGFAHASLILDNPGNIHDHYVLDKKRIGEGSYGAVCKAQVKGTPSLKAGGCTRAVKTIKKAGMKNVESFQREIQIMKVLDHPNIINLYESFEDRQNIYLVMELCEGGELFDRIIDAGTFSEAHAAHLVQQIIKAVFYMHENRIVHRDLKPENFLFHSKDPITQSVLKIIDFGLSCECQPGEFLKTKAGTPYYVSPQVLQARYNELCDIWSVGVIMYVLLCGYPPFYGEKDAEVLAKVKKGKFEFDPADWSSISKDAKDLIRKMLEMDPARRYSAEQALKHDWIAKKSTAPNVSLQQGLVKKLRQFRSMHKLKKAALHIIAGQMPEDHIKGLRDTFIALDKNGDGQLSIAEMKAGFAEAKLDLPIDLEQVLREVDSDGSGVIDYTEFLAATLDQKEFLQDDVCWSAFCVFDKDRDGKITREEVRAVLGDMDVQGVAGTNPLEEMMMQVDSNGDGVIDFQEFMQMMRGKGASLVIKS